MGVRDEEYNSYEPKRVKGKFVTSAVVVDAVRRPMDRRDDQLAHWHRIDPTAQPLLALVARKDLDPLLIDDVLTGVGRFHSRWKSESPKSEISR
jgi:hypothetical protein